MKKFILFFLLCVPLLTSWLVSLGVRAGIPSSQAAAPIPQTYDTYLHFTGNVEFSDTQEISFSLPVLAGNIFVQPGQLVKEGDILFTIDKLKVYEILRDEGLAALDPSGLFSSYEPVMSALGVLNKGLTIEGIVEAYSQIPSTVTAPSDGMVTTLDISTSTLTSPGRVLAAVSPAQSLAVKVSVGEEKIAQIKQGQEALITGAAFGEKTYHGKVETISPLARKTYSGTSQATVVDVYVRITDPDSQLRPGFTTKIKLHIAREEGLTLPYSAVLLDENGGEFVYIWEDGRARIRTVKTLTELEDGTVALTGLTGKELVVLEPEVVEREGTLLRLSGEEKENV